MNDRADKSIPYGWFILAFLVKVIAGMLYGYLHARFYPENDTWVYHNSALEEYHSVLRSPVTFFSINNPLDHINDVFSSSGYAAWKFIGNILLIKILVLFDLLSRGNYYINVALFNIFSFWGLYRIYIVLLQYFNVNRLLLWIIVFFLPSCLFWNSGIHKDGLIVFFTGILLYAIYKNIQQSSIKQFLIAFISIVFLFILRNVTVLLILPAIIAWWWASYSKRNTWLPFIITYGVCVIIFFSSSLLPDQFNLLLRMAERQHQFIGLKANTVLPLKPLNASVQSYIEVLPQAFANAFLHPYITETNGPFQLATFLELLLQFGIILICLFFRRKDSKEILHHPFFLFLLFYSFSSILLIGYTVPFTGAITRYKSFYEMLFLCCFILIIRPSSNKLKL